MFLSWPGDVECIPGVILDLVLTFFWMATIFSAVRWLVKSNRDPKMQTTSHFFLLLLKNVDITFISGLLKGRYALFLRGFGLLVYIFSVRMLFSKYIRAS